MTTTIQKMTETEVSLFLAIYLIISNRAIENVKVAIDGAQVQTNTTMHSNPKDILKQKGWEQEEKTDDWKGVYRHNVHKLAIEVHSNSGMGDVTTKLHCGQFYAEAKKGPMQSIKSSPEYRLLREAVGQIIMPAKKSNIPKDAILAVAVPASKKFVELAKEWRDAPLLQRTGIKILTVSPQGSVLGLDSIFPNSINDKTI